MPTRRTGIVADGGSPVTLIGDPLEVGAPAPGFRLVEADVEGATHAVTLADTPAGVRLFSVVPSIDTSVCSLQAKRFDAEIQRFGDDVRLYTVSVDTPYRLTGFAGECGLTSSTGLSDYRPERSFGHAWGYLIEEIGELCRACVVLDPQGLVRYEQIAPDTWEHVDYEAVLDAVAQAVAAAG